MLLVYGSGWLMEPRVSLVGRFSMLWAILADSPRLSNPYSPFTLRR